VTGAGGLAGNVRTYLRRTGWTEEAPGVAGSLWHHEAVQREPVTIAVPATVRRATVEWRSVTERLASFEQRPTAEVAFRVEHLFVDVTRFRVANDLVIEGSIPLTAGVDLVASAYKLLRASATTARRPRAQIAGNFSRLGDQIADQARLAQTEEGSYILPILMPLSEPPPETEAGLWQHEAGIDRVAPEPPERRVTRTLAQALTVLQTRIVEPAREPKAADIIPLIAAGGSRELVMAVSQVLSDPAVAVFEASFAWASGVTAPAAVPRSISFPAEASDLLTEASKLLLTSRRDPAERMTGPIVEVRHIPDDPFGEVALQTMRQGRQVEIRVRLDRQHLDPTHEWMRTARTIVVEGQVQRDPGKPLRIDGPTGIYPLDESYLPAT